LLDPRDEAKAIAWAAKFGVQRGVGSYEAVINAADVDAVYIPLPVVLHKEWVLKAAANRKHVLCDKPVAESIADLEEMLAACEKHNVLFMDNTMWPHHERTRQIRERVFQQKAIGDVLFVSSTFNWLQKPGDVRLNPAVEPQGSLGDLGWYCVRAIMFAYPDELPMRVWAHAERDAAGVIVSFCAQLFFARNRGAQFSCSFQLNMRQTFTLMGTTGNLTNPDFVWPMDSKYSVYEIASKDGDADYHTQTVHAPEEIQNGSLIKEFERLTEAVRAGQPRNTYWQNQTRIETKIMDALLHAARERREIILSG